MQPSAGRIWGERTTSQIREKAWVTGEAKGKGAQMHEDAKGTTEGRKKKPRKANT